MAVSLEVRPHDRPLSEGRELGDIVRREARADQNGSLSGRGADLRQQRRRHRCAGARDPVTMTASAKPAVERVSDRDLDR